MEILREGTKGDIVQRDVPPLVTIDRFMIGSLLAQERVSATSEASA
jgi:hypothetical protein